MFIWTREVLNNYFRSNVQSKLQRFSPTSTACTSTDTFQPPSSQHISTPTPSQSPKPNSSLQSTPQSSSSFTKIKSRQPIIVEQTTPTQNIIDDEDDSKPCIVPEKDSNSVWRKLFCEPHMVALKIWQGTNKYHKCWPQKSVLFLTPKMGPSFWF